MCGIVGALDLTGRRPFAAARLARMAGAVRHRGPDDFSAWSAPGIALATQRLAIVDPEHGQQPRADASERVWVSYNGELFNADDLRTRLAARGHQLRTQCDTELWPYLYLDHGRDVFAQARGQFAVALWDDAERRLLLGRDRFGICPLFYTEVDGWLLWASEVKALLASELVPRAADRLGIDQFFSLFAAASRRTCFEGVRALLPGHFLDVEAGGLTERRYWDLDFPRQGEERHDEPGRLTEELSDCLGRAVARRVPSHASVATYLSGGIDSTLITALAKQRSPTPLPAFTLGFDEAGFDERPRAVASARALGVQQRVLVASGERIIEHLPLAVRAAESPILDMANVCSLLLARGVAEAGCKVVLTGEGADEALAGYPWYGAQSFMQRLQQSASPLAGGVRRILAGLLTPGAAAPRLGLAFDERRPIQLDMYELMARARSFFYSDDMAARVRQHDPVAELDVEAGRMRAWHPLNQALYLDYKLMLPGHLLQGKGDRVGMQSSVENRYPFLDEELVELCASLSPRYKLRGLSRKWLLRRVAARILPAAMARYPKTMFRAKSLCQLGRAPRWMEQLTSGDSLQKTGYFSPRLVARQQRLQRELPVHDPRRYVTDASYTAVVTTQLWHHLFLGGGLCELTPWSH